MSTNREFDEHNEETCDHRYFPWELNVGWLFHSPAGRMEKVTDGDPGSGRLEYAVRIFTEDTGPDYSWRIPRHHKVHAIPPHPDSHPSAEPHLLIVDLPRGPGREASISLVPGYRWQDIPYFQLMLATARSLGPGQGWQLIDHPDGGDQVVTHHDNKAKARTALMAAAKAHAKALRLPIRKDSDGAQ